ncbi:MAG: DUF2085 domain-containing protein [Vicinamibacterales bacterium]
MRTWLALAIVCWPALLSASVVARATGEAPAMVVAVYMAASRVCHQRPERSFHTHDVQWPVCGRCSGLYLAAPLGAALALLPASQRRSRRFVRVALVLAAIPTALTVVLEQSGLVGITNMVRAMAATPLGLALAWTIVSVAPGGAGPIE